MWRILLHNMMILDNKTAFVTGAAQGIGEGIAIEMAKAGANIIIGDLNPNKARSVVEKVEKFGRESMAVELDVTDKKSIQQAVTVALERFHTIDILVNNAGVVQGGLGNETTDEDFDLCYEVNLKSIWLMATSM